MSNKGLNRKTAYIEVIKFIIGNLGSGFMAPHKQRPTFFMPPAHLSIGFSRQVHSYSLWGRRESNPTEHTRDSSSVLIMFTLFHGGRWLLELQYHNIPGRKMGRTKVQCYLHYRFPFKKLDSCYAFLRSQWQKLYHVFIRDSRKCNFLTVHLRFNKFKLCY